MLFNNNRSGDTLDGVSFSEVGRAGYNPALFCAPPRVVSAYNAVEDLCQLHRVNPKPSKPNTFGNKV